MPVPHIHEMPGDGGGRRHRGRDEVSASLVALAALEITVRCRGATLTGPELVGVHRQAHRAAGLAPFKPGLDENPVEAFSLGLLLHQSGSRYDHGADAGIDISAVHDARDLAQILDPCIRA